MELCHPPLLFSLCTPPLLLSQPICRDHNATAFINWINRSARPGGHYPLIGDDKVVRVCPSKGQFPAPSSLLPQHSQLSIALIKNQGK